MIRCFFIESCTIYQITPIKVKLIKSITTLMGVFHFLVVTLKNNRKGT